MNRTEKTEFDSIAEDYGSIVEDALGMKAQHSYYEQYKMQYLKPIIQSHGNSRGCVKVLDYGCGIGLLSYEIGRACENVFIHGYDISSESIKNIPDRLRVEGNIFTSELGDLETEYDVAILSVVLHHILPEERDTVMENIYTRLRQGGVLVIIEHNLLNILTRRIVNNCAFDRDAIMLNVKQANNLMLNNGYRSVKSRYITFFPELLKNMRWMDKYLGWFPLGAQFLVMGEKLR